MEKLPKWKRRVCEKCHWFNECPIDHDCEALKILDWLYADLCDDNTEIGDWKA